MQTLNHEDKIIIAHPLWWISILFGMSLTGVLALSDAGYALWSEHVTTLISRQLVQQIFIVAVFLHVLEASVAYRLAIKLGHKKSAAAWALQTLMLGYPSLGKLVNQNKHSNKGGLT